MPPLPRYFVFKWQHGQKCTYQTWILVKDTPPTNDIYLEISPKSPLPEPLISFLLYQAGIFCAGYYVSCHKDLSAVQQLTIFQQYKFALSTDTITGTKSPWYVNLMCEVTRSTILGEVINTRCRAVVRKLGGLFFKTHVVRENGDIVPLVEAENSPLSYPIVAMLPRPSPPVRRTGLKAVTNFHQAGWTGSLTPLFIHFVSNQWLLCQRQSLSAVL